jgi:branched-subunit amino acid aminotransferase/4-amino-4-deoxychorismate lyase
MPEPIAYFRDRLLPLSELRLSPYDLGFMQGATVAEQLRTFQHHVFRWEDHARRLARSLQIVGLTDQVSLSHIADVVQRVVDHNCRLIDPADDLGVTVFVTPGMYPTYCPEGGPGATLGVHTYPLPFSLWADKYQQGQCVVISDVMQVPARCWPAELKCRSRMHYYLADQHARREDPAARAILVDELGDVNEATTANVLAWLPAEGLVSPPLQCILPGVSLKVAAELAASLGIPFRYRPFRPPELRGASEILLCSTSPCLLPVVRVDGQLVGDGCPGPIFHRMLAAWSDHVGVAIEQQAVRFRGR